MVARRLSALTLACALLACGETWAEMRDADAGATHNVTASPQLAAASPSWHWNYPLAVVAGASLFKGETGFALALRGPLIKGWMWELGGVYPHFVSGYASGEATTVQSQTTETDSARVHQFGETHAVALYPLYQIPRSPGRPGLTVDAGAGISVAFVDDYIDKQVTGNLMYSTPYHNNVTRVGPRLQLGTAAAFTDQWSVRLDLAWLDYPNDVSLSIHTFNLGFSGVMISPSLQYRF